MRMCAFSKLRQHVRSCIVETPYEYKKVGNCCSLFEENSQLSETLSTPHASQTSLYVYKKVHRRKVCGSKECGKAFSCPLSFRVHVRDYTGKI